MIGAYISFLSYSTYTYRRGHRGRRTYTALADSL